MSPAPAPAPRSLRPALLCTTALLLASCGIPESGVVETGEPATGIRPAQVSYFVSEGTLVPVRRRGFAPVDIETAVATVFQGPDARERRSGMTTQLPPLTGAPSVRAVGDGEVTVELPQGIGTLTETAVAQLICTVAYARFDSAPTTVTVTVPGAWQTEGSSDSCPS
ncbi:hypothetical protein OHA71_09265 [Streptomyces sp. NBC_00444]|uniref:GerMN domain-containing protein n=1 Tax=Streptomyces sp. NBC_00444 TaxID=2975744 RepID=UPI002E20126A